ncbi:MAG: hypothetical protein II932_01155 [Treponema sp.]|nr:hypothetical protein [Treponema sp.]
MKKQNKEMYKVPPYRTGFVCNISIIKELMKKSKGFFTKNKEFFVIYRRSMGEVWGRAAGGSSRCMRFRRNAFFEPAI